MADAVSNVPVQSGAVEAKQPLLGLSFLENLMSPVLVRQLGRC